jgi:hypothetical protein
LKIWIFSVVVHLLLLWALSFIVIPPAEKPSASTVIQSYSYTPIRVKSVPAVIAKPQPVTASKPPESKLPAKKRPSKKARASEATAIVSSAAETASEAKNNSAAGMAETKPSHALGSLSLAQRALATASAVASEPMADRQRQREVVLRSNTPADSELAPTLLKQVKTYADGSELVKGVHGCWKVPPTESRKGATWLMTSTPCETDTTVEQINDILQKRRTYADD